MSDGFASENPRRGSSGRTSTGRSVHCRERSQVVARYTAPIAK